MLERWWAQGNCQQVTFLGKNTNDMLQVGITRKSGNYPKGRWLRMVVGQAILLKQSGRARM